MFDDIITDRRKVYKKELREKIQYFLDAFKFEPDDEKTRKHLRIILTNFLEDEKQADRIKSYVVEIVKKKIKIEVNI